MNGVRFTLLAWCALAASGCDRSSLQLSLGLDSEDKAAQSWLGYYPSHFEPVGECPGTSAFAASPVREQSVKKAFEKLEKTFAVEITAGEAKEWTGKGPPAFDPIQLKAMDAEANIDRAQQVVDAEVATSADVFEPIQAKEALKQVRVAMKNMREQVAPTRRVFVVRGVTYNPGEPPEVQVCYGDVQVFDKHTFTVVPKLYRAPMVLWATTPPRRARITVGSPPQ